MILLMNGFLFGTIPAGSNNAIDDSAFESNQLLQNRMTAVFNPRIDGYIDNNNPAGYLGEWDDSLERELIFQKSNNETEAVDVHSKYVDGSIFVSFIYPTAELDLVAMQIDRDLDGYLSNGDMQLILQNNELSLNILINESAIPINEYLDLDPNFDKLITFSVGEISIGFFDSESHVEIEFTVGFLDSLFRSVKKQDELSFNTPWWNEEFQQTAAYGFVVGAELEIIAGHPDQPSGDQSIISRYTETASYERAPFTNQEQELDWLIAYADIGIDYIEVTQAVQTPDNQRRLVADKTTLARVFLTNPSGSILNTTVSLSAYRVYEGYGNSLSYHYIGTIHETNFFPPKYPWRANLEDSCNFIIPTAWIYHGTLKFTATVTIESGDIVDSNWLNNYNSVTLDFEHTHDLNIYCVTINDGTAETPDLPSTGWMNQQQSFTRAAYPMASPNYVDIGWEVLGASPPTESALLDRLKFIGLAIRCFQNYASSQSDSYISMMLAMFGIFVPPSVIKDNPPLDLIVGFTANSITTTDGELLGQGRLEDIPSWVAPNPFLTNDYTTMAHELNHNLGPEDTWGRHVSDADEGYGCDAPDPDPDWNALYNDGEIHDLGWYYSGLVPSRTRELMTYCQSALSPALWISDYRWGRLFDRLANWDASSIHGYAISSSYVPSSIDIINATARIVSGYISNYDTAELHPSFEFTGYVSEFPPLLSPNASAYLRVGYRDGGSLDIPIETSFRHPDGLPFNHSYFNFALPDNGQIDSLDVLNDEKNITLASYHESIFNFTGSLNYTSVFTRELPTTVGWSLTMTNFTNIYAQLEYSSNGIIWYPIGMPTTGNSALVRFTTLPGGENCRFRLQLSDGVSTQNILGPSFSLSNLAPIIEVSHGVPITTISAGSHLSLSFTATDPEFGEIGENYISWRIFDSEGEVDHGHGNTVDSQLVIPGVYEISIEATDLSGFNTTESIYIEVTNPIYLEEATWTKFLAFLDNISPTTNATTTTTTTNWLTENQLIVGAAAGSLFTALLFVLVLIFRRR